MTKQSKSTDSTLHDLWLPDAQSAPNFCDLGDTLIERGVIDRAQVDTARRVLKQTPGSSIAQVLLNMGADEHSLLQVVAEHVGVDYVMPNKDDIHEKALNTLGIEYCESSGILPLADDQDRVRLAMSSTDDLATLDEVRAMLGGQRLTQVLCGPSTITALLNTLKSETEEDLDVEELLADAAEDDVSVVEAAAEEECDDGSSSPVVRYVNHIIQTAVREGASDIHIEPSESAVRVRLRIDGVLYETMNPPRKMLASITSRIKIMASLDIAERRLPQDGRIRVQVFGRPLDLRVSTARTPHGEKTVMRLLDNRSVQVPVEKLGFRDDLLTDWQAQIAKPHGILLVTGPTGSGKTTTLYASLQELDLQRLNVSTVEDPVEYQVQGITQIQTHDRIGMTFGAALRTLLRQDPDVIMVGEIRDQETATIAIQAALTGHLVLSTLHTNDAPSSITRLINIGIEPFLVSGAVNAVLAQRLMRRVCTQCSQKVPVSDTAAEYLARINVDAKHLVEGGGCDACRETGLSGRLGVHEILKVDDDMRDHIARNPSVNELRQHCVNAGMMTLREDALHKMAVGQTTLSEVLRVTGDT
ncbi:MAG: Flp pilus assembly complex ATPase component TadA [Phycisphaerales bacterium]|nr:Flp pilus assembly complex ATPase component TadA [Phycisphaerales bacterium]